jgi:hypothetical protein
LWRAFRASACKANFQAGRVFLEHLARKRGVRTGRKGSGKWPENRLDFQATLLLEGV